MKDLSKSISKVLGSLVPFIIILATVTPFVVSQNMFFPYITGKAFYFRILVEILALLYIVWALVDKSVRPRWSPVSISATVFLGVLTLATAFAVDPLKSFWSNFERMEGLILFIHLIAYFFIAGSVMKYKQSWFKWFFNTSLVLSVLIGINAFVDFYSGTNQTGYRIFGSLGNSSYLGVYSLIHIFISLFMMMKVFANKTIQGITKEGSWVSIGFYALVGIFNLIVLFNTGTRGSFVGLVAGVFVAAALIAIFERKNKTLRKVSIGLISVTLLFVALLGFGRNSEFVKNSDMLTRFSELITLDVKGVLENQGKSRSLLWGIAWEGVKERPVIGWGLDNFHYVFSEHYDPAMYGQEQWFDRSHNVFFDWLTQAGFLGLIAYLSLFGTALYVVWRKNEDDDGFTGTEKAIITGGFVAYLGHNLFVFDNLSSYLLFFSVLAFIHQYSIRKRVNVIDNDSKHRYAEFGTSTILTVSILATALIVYTLYVGNIVPMNSNMKIIDSIRPSVRDPKTGREVATTPQSKFEALQSSIALNAMTNSEQIEQLTERGAELMTSPTVTNEYKVNAHSYIVSHFVENINRTPTDPRVYFFYSIYLQKIGFNKEATEVIKKAVELSPNKQSFLSYYGLLLMQEGQVTEGLPILQKAYELDISNTEAKYVYLASLVQNNRAAEAEKIAVGDTVKYSTNAYVLEGYIASKQSSRIIELLKKEIASSSNSVELRSALASVYLRSNNPVMAISTLEEIKKIAPQFSDSIDQTISQIKEQAKIK